MDLGRKYFKRVVLSRNISFMLHGYEKEDVTWWKVTVHRLKFLTSICSVSFVDFEKKYSLKGAVYTQSNNIYFLHLIILPKTTKKKTLHTVTQSNQQISKRETIFRRILYGLDFYKKIADIIFKLEHNCNFFSQW